MATSTELQPGGIALGIVGAGVMGRGIARLAAQAGTPVLLHDARDGAALQATDELRHAWQGSVAKGRMAAAMAVTESEEVLVARTQLTGIVSSSAPNSACFAARSSTIASITRVQ
jgi:3-hydroxyisobutyrate dehydrogenase-like beta-hydroxyacid dehydrogenase